MQLESLVAGLTKAEGVITSGALSGVVARLSSWPLLRDVEQLSNAATFPAKGQMTEEKITMKAIVVTDQAAGTAGLKLVERPEPQAAVNDVVVQVHASGFVPTEMAGASP